jgi:hypothetical protein
LPLIFSPRFDSVLRQTVVGAGLAVLTAVGLFYYYALPSYTRVGYQPEQPVPFSHAQHVGQLGLDCRYCHTHVTESPHASVPPTATCMNCHSLIKTNSPLLSQVRESWASGQPVSWKRVHKLPDYAYFNHAVHVARGVGCVSCHGQINEMPVVFHDKELSMGWCLNCHRAPENHLRPVGEVVNMTWKPSDVRGPDDRPSTQLGLGQRLKDEHHIAPPQTCQGCHR